MDAGNGDLITKRDAFVACMAALLLGAVLSALVLVGSDVPLKCFEGGNLADWLAALGTWVIGYGAWKYARDNYRHGMEEALRRKKQEEDRTIARIEAMIGICNQLLAVTRMVSNPPALYQSGDIELKTKALLDVALTWLNDADWSDVDKTLLTKEAGADLRQLRLSFLSFCSAAEFTMSYFDKGGRASDKEAWGEARWAKALMDSCRSLDKRAEAFKKRLLGIRKVARG